MCQVLEFVQASGSHSFKADGTLASPSLTSRKSRADEVHPLQPLPHGLVALSSLMFAIVSPCALPLRSGVVIYRECQLQLVIGLGQQTVWFGSAFIRA